MLITYSEMAGKKGPNFSQLEKHTLVDLIGPKKDIIESKASDANMVYKKILHGKILRKNLTADMELLRGPPPN